MPGHRRRGRFRDSYRRRRLGSRTDRILSPQDRPVQALQLAVGIHPQLLHQQLLGVEIPLQRVRAAATGVQRPDQGGGEVLRHRVVLAQLGQRADDRRRAAGERLGLGPGHHGGQVLGLPRAPYLCRPVAGEVAERDPAPQPHGVLQRRTALFRGPDLFPGRGDKLPVSAQVDLVGPHVQEVAAGAAHDGGPLPVAVRRRGRLLNYRRQAALAE